MPKTTPRAPFPLAASLFAPLVWQYGRPDLFDTYAAGIILMQARAGARARGLLLLGGGGGTRPLKGLL